MALIQNDIDNLLTNTAVRLVAVDNNYILLSSSISSFNVVNGVATPAFATITARLFGALAGVCTFSVVSGASSITTNNNVAQLNYTALTADAATIRATLVYLGTTYTAEITVGGQTAKPSAVQNFAAAPSASLLNLTWTANTDADIAGYEVRETNMGWGTTTGYLFKGSATRVLVTPKALNTAGTWYIKAYDTSGLYSDIATSVTYTVAAPADTTDILFAFADTSLTNATVTLDWLAVRPAFGLSGYQVTGTISAPVTTTAGSAIISVGGTYGVIGISPGDDILDNPNIPLVNNVSAKVLAVNYTNNTCTISRAAQSSGTAVQTKFVVTKSVNANTIQLPANWLGNKQFTVRTIDLLGNLSSGYSEFVPKSLPDPVLNLAGQVVDNTVSLSWTLPARTTLPVLHVLLKKSPVGGTWETAELVGTKSGEFTTVQELAKGTYMYWVATVDTDDNESQPVSVTLDVQSPPDYVFNSRFSSKEIGFPGEKFNAVYADGELVLNVNTLETFEEHFTSQAITTPAQQIAAGNPVYIQPGELAGAYTEIFDLQQTLASSAIRITVSGRHVTGLSDIILDISTSADGVNYSPSTSSPSLFATNFRFIKIQVVSIQGDTHSIYAVSDIVAVLDTKLRTDSGNSSDILATDAKGTPVNFNYEFIDVSAISVTPFSATGALRIPVYNFKDEIQAADYIISGNVITVTKPGTVGHGFIVGQLIRLAIPSVEVVRVIITSISTTNAPGSAENRFTANLTAPNSDGTLSMYPNSMTVFLYNDSGVRQSGAISWTARGS